MLLRLMLLMLLLRNNILHKLTGRLMLMNLNAVLVMVMGMVMVVLMVEVLVLQRAGWKHVERWRRGSGRHDSA